MAATTDRPKRTYTRRKPLGKRLVLNTFQADVLLGAIKTEINRVEGARDVPASLRILALEQLREVQTALETPDLTAVPDADSA